MEQDILAKLAEQEVKIDKIYKSVEKTRKYFMWTLIITLVTFLAPLLIMIIALPKVISVYTSGLSI